ncbi:MAG: PocR ligand-binding domain-containing protein [Desulfobulbaceae bacterium]|nr:PocR ligand-binding domain-containing protein [Desulfobulbaceae bacterium]
MDNQSNLHSSELDDLKKRVAELEEREIHLLADYEHLKHLYERAPLAYQSLDIDGCFIEVNQAWLETLGYNREEVIGKNFSNFLHPDWREHFKENFPKFKAIGEILGIEFEMVKKDGSPILVAFHGRIGKDSLGQFQQTHCIFHDITKRKQDEEALRESEERFRALHNASFGGIVIHDHGVILDCNQGLSDQTGYAIEELIGMDGFLLIAPDYRDLVMQNVQRGFEQTYEIVGLRKDGTRYPVSIQGTNIPYKGRTVRVTEFRDITAYKQMEEALEKRLVTLTCPLNQTNGITFEDLFDPAVIQRIQDEFAAATGVASIITLPDGTPLTAPSNFTYLCSEIIRKTEQGCSNCFKSDAAIGCYHPSGPIVQPCLSGGLWDAGASITVGGHHIANWLIGQVKNETQNEENMRAYARAINADEAAFMQAFHAVPSMSRERFEHIAQALFTLANQLSSSAYQNIQQARSITERKQAEAEREKLKAQLQQSQKLESVARLAGGIAHDFNNMLTVIQGHADLALMNMNLDDPYFHRFRAIQDTVQRSTDLTRQLLAFARKQPILPKVLDLNETVEKMLTMLRRLIGEDINLTWKPGTGLWLVKVDPSQIDQILANLCVNARDAIAGVGKIIVETGNSTFDAEYCATHDGFVPGDYVRISVNDNGIGMDKETVAKIFEPFFTTKEIGRGTGLGLATVYGAIKQNNGFINVYSEPGQGTRFTIYLPRHEGEAVKARIEDAAGPVTRGHETILLVEDELTILKMTTTILQQLGYNVLAANTPSEAISLVKAHDKKIDLLLTDVIMPEMNGRDLAERLQINQPWIKRLFMSGYTADIIAHQGVLDEGVYFIQKPFSRIALAAKVRKVLDCNEGDKGS